jgi:hypothetical protein
MGVATRGQRMDQREQLAARAGRTGPVAQVHQLVGDLLDPEPLGQRRRQQQPGMRDRVLVVERDIDAVKNDVRGSHRKGTSGSGSMSGVATLILPGQEALFTIQPASTHHRIG